MAESDYAAAADAYEQDDETAPVLEAVDEIWGEREDGLTADEATADHYTVLDTFLSAMESGDIRTAEQTTAWSDVPAYEESGDDLAVSPYSPNEQAKRGILLNFGLRPTREREYGGVTYHDVLPLRRTDDLGERGTRNTPDGTTIRRGAYVGSDAILMSPAFVNIGAHVGDGTLVDSCDTVGSAAQIGDNVKLGANTLIGGVLEPVEDAPVIVEDGASLGAGCRVTSGFVVGEDTVVGENTLLTPRIPVYDLVDDEVRYGHLPPERRAFTRFVESSVSDHDLFDGGAYKPAVVATDVPESTVEATEREDALRE